MKYICCIWLCIVWLVCQAQHRVVGLHIQQAPEIIQRITRQATRYGGGAVGSSGPNYRPVPGPASNYNLRTSGSEPSSGLTSSQLNGVSSNSGQRPVGVGAYSFGGMASGRPSNGNSFAISSPNLGKVGNPVIKGGIGNGVIRSQPQPNQPIIGSGSVAGSGISGSRPQHLQQALLQAAQYQLQQHQQQQQQLRRQIPQQQLYRQRPAPSTYQQYN